MGESREELIAKRDEIIEQLQGEWAIDKDIKSTNRKALRLGRLIIVAGMVLIVVIFPGMYLFTSGEERANLLDGAGEFGLTMLALMAFFGGLVFVGTHVQAWWHRKLNPILVDGHRLVWNKKKGFVPERLNLHTLYSMITNEPNDMVLDPGGTIFVKLLGVVAKLSSRFGGSSRPVSDAELAMGAFACFYPQSPGELNSPKIMPSMFVDGDRLVKLLIEVAAINTKLNELDEADKPEA